MLPVPNHTDQITAAVERARAERLQAIADQDAQRLAQAEAIDLDAARAELERFREVATAGGVDLAAQRWMTEDGVVPDGLDPDVAGDELLVGMAEALESGHRPILTPGAAVFEVPRRFLLNRYKDDAGTTGVGAVAWGCLWPSGRVSLDWQTERSMKGGYYESMDDVLAMHGHQTALEWLDDK